MQQSILLSDAFDASVVDLGSTIAKRHARNPKDFAQSFREAVLTSQLNNPHLIDASGVKWKEGKKGKILEYEMPKGTSLSNSHPIQWNVLINVLLDVVCGLKAMHSIGLVHGDIKPDNIIEINGRGKLIDMGHSSPATLIKEETHGTLGYYRNDLSDDPFLEDIEALVITVKNLLNYSKNPVEVDILDEKTQVASRNLERRAYYLWKDLDAAMRNPSLDAIYSVLKAHASNPHECDLKVDPTTARFLQNAEEIVRGLDPELSRLRSLVFSDVLMDEYRRTNTQMGEIATEMLNSECDPVNFDSLACALRLARRVANVLQKRSDRKELLHNATLITQVKNDELNHILLDPRVLLDPKHLYNHIQFLADDLSEVAPFLFTLSVLTSEAPEKQLQASLKRLTDDASQFQPGEDMTLKQALKTIAKFTDYTARVNLISKLWNRLLKAPKRRAPNFPKVPPYGPILEPYQPHPSAIPGIQRKPSFGVQLPPFLPSKRPPSPLESSRKAPKK